MQVISSRQNLAAICENHRQAGRSIGFVPTMGALHEGHLSLVKKCREENDIVVVSIFVNPTQFNKPDDLKHYPRTLEQDLALLRGTHCDLVFTPSDDDMYPQPPVIRFQFGHLENTMEGANRPGHFNGVGIVVSKLFHIVQPHHAYFGQKDFQQLAIIRQLVTDVGFNIQIHACPTERSADGLALSSRNARLLPEHRQQAPILYRILQQTADALRSGAAPSEAVQQQKQHLSEQQIACEYLEIVHPTTLQPIVDLPFTNEVAICIAAYFGNVRLIDNIVVRIN